MPRGREAGLKAAQTHKSKYGEDYYSKLGKQGAEAYKQRLEEGVAKPRGFAAMDKEKVRAAGSRGGSVSRRGASSN